MIGGVNYEAIDERGLLISYGDKREKATLLEVDTIVLCTGQEPLRELAEPLRAGGANVHIVGGADVAAELDAKRAIRSEEHTSELQSLMRISYAVFCLKKKKKRK